MRSILTLLLILFAKQVSAQKDTVIRYFSEQLEPCKKKEAVYVGALIRSGINWNAVVFDTSRQIIMRGNYLDKDAQIKNGYFTYFTPSGKRFLAGEYIQNQKTGLWQTWYPSGNPKDSVYFENNQSTGPCSIHYDNGKREVSGEYIAGTLTGKWLWYHENGQLASAETWKNGLLEDISCYDTLGHSQGLNCAVAAMPTLKGFYGGIEKVLVDSLQYPKELYEKGIDGYVIVSFTIKKTGKLDELKVVYSSEKAFTDEVLRVINKLPDWYPAVSHNRVLDQKLAYRIPFPTYLVEQAESPEQLLLDGVSK